MMPPATVHIQGITADLSAANGDYDTITYGLNTAQEVSDFFSRIRHLEVPPGDDICPPSVVLEAGERSLQFVMGGGHVYCEQTGTYIEPSQIPDLVADPQMASSIRQQVQQQSGVQPLRMHHVQPTDPELDTSGVDVGPSSPQLRFLIRRGATSHLTPYVVAIPGLMMVAVGVWVMLNDPVPGLVFAGLSAVPVALFPWLKGRTQKSVRIGFDWKTNTVWTVDELDGRVQFQENANLISDFVMEKQSVETDNQAYVFDDAISAGGTETYWYLRANRVDHTWDSFYFMEFYSKKERDEVLRGMTMLLGRQG